MKMRKVGEGMGKRSTDLIIKKVVLLKINNFIIIYLQHINKGL